MLKGGDDDLKQQLQGMIAQGLGVDPDDVTITSMKRDKDGKCTGCTFNCVCKDGAKQANQLGSPAAGDAVAKAIESGMNRRGSKYSCKDGGSCTTQRAATGKSASAAAAAAAAASSDSKKNCRTETTCHFALPFLGCLVETSTEVCDRRMLLSNSVLARPFVVV